MDFGHFRTLWREWPTEPRPDKTFPQSIGIETVPTPPAQKQEELPLAAPGVSPGTQPLIEPPLAVPPLTTPPSGMPQPPLVAPPSMDLPMFEPPVAAPPEVQPPPVQPPAAEPPVAEPPLAEPPLAEPPVTTPSLPDETPFDPGSVIPGMPLPSTDAAPLEPPAVEPGTPPPGSGVDITEPFPHPPVAQKEREEAESAVAEVPASPVETELPELPRLAPPSVDDVAENPGLDAPDEPNSVTPAVAEVPEAAPEGPLLQKPGPKPLQANWMAALHAGFRGDARQMVQSRASTPTAQPAAQQAAYQTASAPAPYGLEYATAQPATSNVRNVQSAGHPPVALDGFCPVELVYNERWVRGNPGLTAVYGGRTYLLANAAARERFMTEPDRFVPRYQGSDPVLVVEEGRQVAGQTDYCVTYEGFLYMFSSQVTLSHFQTDPRRYVPRNNRQ